MAEGDCLVTNNLKKQLLLKAIDFVNDDFRMALYDFAIGEDGAPVYTVASEIVAANYVAGGELLTSNAVTQDDVNDLAKFDLDNVSWTNLGVHLIVQARLYDDTTASKWVLLLWEITTPSSGNVYRLEFDSAGVLLLM